MLEMFELLQRILDNLVGAEMEESESVTVYWRETI